MIRFRRLIFLIAWKTTNKQMLVVYHSELTVLCCSSVIRLRHVQFFRKNRRSFAWKCFVREQLLLDLTHLETPIQSTAVYFRVYTLRSTIHHQSRCHRHVSKHRNRIFGAFLSTKRHKPFFERLKYCMGFNANKFFSHSNVHAVLNVCWSH